MLICCPQCQFERELDENTIPANAAVATCPQCRCRFRFRAPDGSFLDPVVPVESPPVESSPQDSAPPETDMGSMPDPVLLHPSADAEEDSSQQEEQWGEPASDLQEPVETSEEQQAPPDDDDPLPPGAVIPRIPSDVSLEKKPEAPQSDGPPVKKSWKDSFGTSPTPPKESSTLKENINKTKQRLLGQENPSLSQHEANVSVPWEQPRKYGVLMGLYHTILRVMFNAPRFYAGLTSASSGISRPLVFYLILGMFQVLVKRMWFLMSLEAVTPSITDPQVQEMIGALTDSMSLPLTLITAPVIIVAQIFFFTAIFFLMIRLVQPDSAHFLTIFRVVAYSAAPTVICIVPFVGQVVGSVWFAVCCFIGCKYAMRLPWSRVGLALGPPYLVALAIGIQIAQRMMMGG